MRTIIGGILAGALFLLGIGLLILGAMIQTTGAELVESVENSKDCIDSVYL